jgi:hypothetical protein
MFEVILYQTMCSEVYLITHVDVIVWKLDLQLHMQSVHITTDVVSSNIDQAEVRSVISDNRGGQFYWWRKRRTRKKPPTCRKSLTIFIT